MKKKTTARPSRERSAAAAVSPERQEAPAYRELSEQDDRVKILYYGDNGTGKTTALATAARRGPILFIDAESGIKRGALSRPELGIPIANIKTVKAVTYDELSALLWRLRAEFDEDPDAWFAVCIDSMTEVQAAMLAEEMDSAARRASIRGMERDPFAVEGGDWQRNTEAMRRLIRGFRELPCHVGFAAQLRRDVDSDGMTVYSPQLTPKVAGDLVGYVDICAAMQPVIMPSRVEGGRTAAVYSAFTARAGKFRAKDRFGALPRQMANPSFDRVIDYVAGELSAGSDPEQKRLRTGREKE